MNSYKKLDMLMKQRGLSLLEIASESGVSKSTLYDWKKGIREPKKDNIAKIAIRYDVPLSYFFEDDDIFALEPEFVKIKVLGTVPAGVPIEAVEDIIGEEVIAMSLAKTGEYFGLRIKGDSMEPELRSGDVAIVRQQEDVESGQTAIVIINGDEATCKKVEKYDNGIMLVPLNKKYEEKFYSNEDIEKLPVRIIGRVVQSRRNH